MKKTSNKRKKRKGERQGTAAARSFRGVRKIENFGATSSRPAPEQLETNEDEAAASGEMRREIAGRRMILRHRDLVAEMFGCVVSPTHRPALRGGGTHVHTHTRDRVLIRWARTCALTHASPDTGRRYGARLLSLPDSLAAWRPTGYAVSLHAISASLPRHFFFLLLLLRRLHHRPPLRASVRFARSRVRFPSFPCPVCNDVVFATSKNDLSRARCDGNLISFSLPFLFSHIRIVIENILCNLRLLRH